MADRKIIFIKISGTGILQTVRARSIETAAYGNSTYHRIVLENGVVWMLNDFGIRSIYTADNLEDLN